MNKKNILIASLALLFIILSISNIYLVFEIINRTPEPLEPSTFRNLVSSAPDSLDPLNASSYNSRDVIHQVCEGLFAYDLREIDLPRINHLANEFFWLNHTSLAIKVREGIYFHDNYPFNATAVKWTLDRINYFINATGMLPSSTPRAELTSIFYLPDGITPIINCTKIIDEFNVTIHLNAPYSPILNLLCHQSCYILSPRSTPATHYIEINGDLVGTGPYKFDKYIQFEEVQFSRWDGYWRNLAHFEKLIYIIDHAQPPDNVIDWYSFYHWSYGNPNTTIVKDFTEDTGIPRMKYYYLGFNNEIYNVSWRKAMSYAINYSDISNLIYDLAIRSNSPISPGFKEAYNSSAKAANYNLTKARLVMESMGFGVGFVNDSQWQTVAEGPTPFLTVNYTFNIANSYREEIFELIEENFKFIGIKVVENGVAWNEYRSYIYETPEFLSLYAHNYYPEVYDPFYVFRDLFNPNSNENIAQVDDSWLNSKLNLITHTSNDTIRNNLYKEIQGYITEVGYYHAPLYHSKLYFWHASNIYNPIYNVLDLFEVYYMYRS
ncbi:MAG: ABC transporter substrate-binding protein [Promethearchaeota archaeon]|nr:MAG: ABC transporter substrate-binding protein [Candidatus Lokiarchaeota archaeon]